jgi:nicotinamidase-related amidase
MHNIYGKEVFESLEEIVDPRHVALIVVDMQNDLVSPDGYLGKLGHDLTGNRRIIPSLRSLLSTARDKRIPIVFIQYVMESNRASLSPAWIYHSTRQEPRGNSRRVNLEACVEGTWGAQIIPELSPLPQDFIIRKHRLSGFSKTRLDQILRSNQIQSVIVTGTATGGCVQDTAVDASTHFDYYTVIAEDCVTQNDLAGHVQALAFLKRRFDMASSDELIGLWSKDQRRDERDQLK